MQKTDYSDIDVEMLFMSILFQKNVKITLKHLLFHKTG